MHKKNQRNSEITKSETCYGEGPLYRSFLATSRCICDSLYHSRLKSVLINGSPHRLDGLAPRALWFSDHISLVPYDLHVILGKTQICLNL